jgi:hypothetical protein
VISTGPTESLRTNQVQELLHCGRALRVCDSIENILGYLGVGHCSSNGMGGDHLILSIAPAFTLIEHHANASQFDGLDVEVFEAEVRNEISVTLVEP